MVRNPLEHGVSNGLRVITRMEVVSHRHFSPRKFTAQGDQVHADVAAISRDGAEDEVFACPELSLEGKTTCLIGEYELIGHRYQNQRMSDTKHAKPQADKFRDLARENRAHENAGFFEENPQGIVIASKHEKPAQEIKK